MEVKRYAAAAVIMLAAAPLLGGCSSTAKTSTTPPAASTTQGTSPTQSQGTGGSTAPTSAQPTQSGTAGTPSTAQATPGTPPQSGTTAPGSTPACRTSTLIIVYPPGDNPLRSACLHIGVDAQITLSAAGGGRVWSPVTASSPAVVGLTDVVGADHSRHVTVRPLHPGTTTLTSSSSFAPDPHGPPTRQWTLTLTIVP